MSYKHALIRFYRSFMVPLDPVTAEKWHWRFKAFYLFTALQVAVLTVYIVQKDKITGKDYVVEQSDIEKKIRLYGLQNVKVVNMDLRGKRDEVKMDLNEIEKNYNEKKAEIYEKYSV